MLKVGAYLDSLLNSITMYRLVLYLLIFYVVLSFIFSVIGIVPYTLFQLVESVVVLVASGLFFNIFFSKLYNAPTNVESVYITSLILYFLILPPDIIVGVLILIFAVFLAMGSKYVVAHHRKHIFNPAAFAAVFLGAIGIGTSLWWIGIPAFLPFTLVGGILIVRKIRKFRMLLTFLAISTLTACAFGLVKGAALSEVIGFMYISGPIIFFSSIMFTEPSTTPPTGKKQLIYGSIVGLIYGSQFHIGPLFSSPELALIIGNIYSYLVSSKERLLLTLESQKMLAMDTYEFVFKPDRKLNYIPGQYLEWTLPHKKSDSRGVRRYFTIASAPTEAGIRLGVKYCDHPSSFKKKLLSLAPGDKLSAGQLAGDFLLPKDTAKKLVFIAGGIGITPFRSMVQYMIDKGEVRDTVLFYSNKTENEIAYKELFMRAEKQGVKTVYLLTDKENAPKVFAGEIGRIDEHMINKYVPDYKKRIFYLSGPNAMVHAYKELLVKMGVVTIVTDYFPGF